MILVEPIEKEYEIEMTHEDVKVVFTFCQLTYEQKADIVSRTTKMKQGRVVQDITLNSFLTVKNALKSVTGLHCLVDGKEKEYTLQFDAEGLVTDKNLNELFNTPFQDNLVFSANHLSSGIPDEIIHPLTRQKLEGVEILPQKGSVEKKS